MGKTFKNFKRDKKWSAKDDFKRKNEKKDSKYKEYKNCRYE